jgi:hypothetical protein
MAGEFIVRPHAVLERVLLLMLLLYAGRNPSGAGRLFRIKGESDRRRLSSTPASSIVTLDADNMATASTHIA